MNDWIFAQHEPAQQLARLHFFSIKKKEPAGEVEFLITVREHVPSGDRSMLFFAQADKQTNQLNAPYTPSGWGDTLLKALSECVQAIHRFPYEGPGHC